MRIFGNFDFDKSRFVVFDFENFLEPHRLNMDIHVGQSLLSKWISSRFGKVLSKSNIFHFEIAILRIPVFKIEIPHSKFPTTYFRLATLYSSILNIPPHASRRKHFKGFTFLCKSAFYIIDDRLYRRRKSKITKN